MDLKLFKYFFESNIIPSMLTIAILSPGEIPSLPMRNEPIIIPKINVKNNSDNIDNVLKIVLKIFP